jgi:hypothetical protein
VSGCHGNPRQPAAAAAAAIASCEVAVFAEEIEGIGKRRVGGVKQSRLRFGKEVLPQRLEIVLHGVWRQRTNQAKHRQSLEAIAARLADQRARLPSC